MAEVQAQVTPVAKAAEPVKDQKAVAQPDTNGKDAQPVKQANPIEEEVSKKYGDEWKAFPQKVKERIIEAESKVRDADKKYQQIARIQKEYDLTQKQVQSLFQALKTDPIAVLSNPALGHDVRKLAEEYVMKNLDREIADSKLSPEARELRAAKAKLEEYEKKQSEDKKAAEQKENEGKIAAARQRFEKLIIETIENEKLPKTSGVMAQMAYEIKLRALSGQKLDMKEIAEAVKSKYLQWQREFLENAPDEKLMELMPQPLIEKLRKADLAKLREKGLLPKPGPKPSSSPKERSEKMSMSEWLDRRAERLAQ